MADEFKTQYNNPLQVTGLKIIEPTPVDDRLLIESEDTIKNLFRSPVTIDELTFISALYDGLIILAGDSKKEYIWCESNYGLLDSSYSYPVYATNVAGQNYAGKSYNFVLYDNIAKIAMTFNNASDVGLIVPTNLLPYRVIKEPSYASVTLKSSTTGYTEIEFPDRIEAVTSELRIILDPKPAVGEQFRITIQ